MRTVFVLFGLIFQIFAGAVYTQDVPTIEDILRWIPCGETGLITRSDDSFIENFPEEIDTDSKEAIEKYIIAGIVHFDQKMLMETCPGEIRDEYLIAGGNLLNKGDAYIDWRLARSLPPALTHQYDSMTIAHIAMLGVKVSEETAEDGSIRRLNRKCAFAYQANGHYYCAWLPTRRIDVYRFTDLDSLVRQALRNGELALWEDKTLFERPIFVYRRQGTEQTIYCYATYSQEFLVAEEPGDLVNMINAGMSYNPQDFESLDLSGLKSISSDDYLWTFRNEAAMFSLLRDYLMDRDPDSPSLEEVKNLLQTGKLSMIDEYRWNPDGGRSQIITMRYGDEEGAKADCRKLMRSPDKNETLVLNTLYFLGRAVSFKPTVRRLNEVRKEMTISLDGDRLILTRADDKEALLRILDVLRKIEDEAEEKALERAKRR